MIITENNRYLVIPVRRDAEERRIYFYDGDILLRDLIVCVDFEKPDYTAYYDLKTFMGKDICIVCDKGSFETSDKIQHEEDTDIRPKWHYSAETGWLNDPNGMIFYEGRYHLFYQSNPVGTARGSQHWGHAVSYDLIHWEDWDIALFPDDMGTMFSGCAIEDKDNILGMKVNEHNPLVLIYTASGDSISEAAKGKSFTQCLAISVDGGRNFEKYKNNPVIGKCAERTRDPNVVYDEQSKMFIMALFMDSDDNDFGFFKSSDLVNWTEISRLKIPGERVCPDIYTLMDNQKHKWVFSGGNNFYVTADLDIEKGLINLSEPRKFGYGTLYAGQTFNNCDRIIRIAWTRLTFKVGLGEWEKLTTLPTKKYSQFMSIPTEINLKDDILRVNPAIDFEKTEVYSNVKADKIRYKLLKKPVSLYIKPSDLSGKLKIEIFGNVVEIENNTVKFTNLWNDCFEMPFEGELKIFTDNISMDLFSSDKYYASYQAISNYNSDFLEISGDFVLEKLEWGYFSY